MEKQYRIYGMTCESCVSTVRRNLEAVSGVESAQVQLHSPELVLSLNKNISLEELSESLKLAGDYTISGIEASPTVELKFPQKSISTYKPLLIIILFIAGVSMLEQYPFSNFSLELWMRHFMAGFFIVFSFFKLINLNGFADSYQRYDIVASNWKVWGYIYPFIELVLGISYMVNFAPYYTSIATVIILGVSSIGVINSNIRKRRIKCACLGDVFNLPMSIVTIIEDLIMVLMAFYMLFL